MLIRCTKKLLDELKVKPESVEEGDPLFSWHANIIMVNRKKTVVLMNDPTRYAVVLYGLKAKDFARFNDIALQGIRDTFQAEGITDEVISQYLLRSKEVSFTKTKDRTSVARMNRACDNVYYFEELLTTASIFQPDMSMRISRLSVGDGKSRYLLPHEELFKNLTLFAGRSIFEMEAVVLKVTLRLENHQVWRRLVVPTNRTFAQLHQIVQKAFGWRNYHLHDFTIFDKAVTTNESAKPIINLVCDQEAFSYPGEVDMKLEQDVLLSEYIPAYDRVTYKYDFGDDWQHEIEVEKMIENYDANHPVCLDGEGSTPPEDVGGEHGYEEFLSVLADPDHPDFADRVKWGRMQQYRDFDKNIVNLQLKGY